MGMGDWRGLWNDCRGSLEDAPRRRLRWGRWEPAGVGLWQKEKPPFLGK